ncbi:MAG TPA: PPOX class F420-dependent oxidoreductase [Ktedonobacterales bacterium]|jgi:PPOX class probable F420-dependent enzyme
MTLSDDVRAFLEEKRFAVLATINADGAPQQTVMWYELQGNEIMMNTRDGRVKAGNFRRDPRASICVEDGYRGVTIQGTVRLIEDPETAQADIRRLAVLNHGPEKGAAMAENSFAKQRRLTIRLPIEHVMPHGFDV